MTAAIANERKASLMTASSTKAVRTQATAIAIAPNPTPPHPRYKPPSHPFPMVSGIFQYGESPAALRAQERNDLAPRHPVIHLFRPDATRPRYTAGRAA